MPEMPDPLAELLDAAASVVEAVERAYPLHPTESGGPRSHPVEPFTYALSVLARTSRLKRAVREFQEAQARRA